MRCREPVGFDGPPRGLEDRHERVKHLLPHFLGWELEHVVLPVLEEHLERVPSEKIPSRIKGR
jgi:hypothetical protein